MIRYSSYIVFVVIGLGCNNSGGTPKKINSYSTDSIYVNSRILEVINYNGSAKKDGYSIKFDTVLNLPKLKLWYTNGQLKGPQFDYFESSNKVKAYSYNINDTVKTYELQFDTNNRLLAAKNSPLVMYDFKYTSKSNDTVIAKFWFSDYYFDSIVVLKANSTKDYHRVPLLDSDMPTIKISKSIKVIGKTQKNIVNYIQIKVYKETYFHTIYDTVNIVMH